MCERWGALALEHWGALALEHYEPLSETQCNEIVQETLETIKTHKLPQGVEDTGAVGWHNSIQLDDDGRFVHFVTGKTVPHRDIEQLVDLSWSIYSDGDLYKKYHHDDKCDFFLQVIQQVSPDVMVTQHVEKYPNLVQWTHTLALVFRVKTETGSMIVFRSIESPQLQKQLKADGLSLSGNFWWDTFHVARRDESGACDTV